MVHRAEKLFQVKACNAGVTEINFQIMKEFSPRSYTEFHGGGEDFRTQTP
jgi:hypothetical protein